MKIIMCMLGFLPKLWLIYKQKLHLYWQILVFYNSLFSFIWPDDTFHSMNSELRELPAIELSTLPLILKVSVNVILKN